MSKAELTTHSPIGASSYHRWGKCPGSIRLSATVEKRTSSYAEEGTLAHEVAAQRITTGKWPAGVDPDMADFVQIYVDYINKSCAGFSKRMIEHSFDLAMVHPGLYGTCDAIIFDDEERVLRVIDFKYGAGIPVEVEANEQLLYYALGALRSTNFSCDAIELTIVQPRCPHPNGVIRSFRLPIFEILEFESDLKAAAIRTEAKDAPLVPGDHCRFCPANGICPAVKEKAQALAKQAFSEVTTESYNPAELSETLRWLPVVESWAENVRSFAYSEAVAGRTPPGFKLVAKRAIRKWSDEDAATKLTSGLSKDVAMECFETSLKSPAKLEKFLHEKQMKKFEPFISKISSGETLVENSDSRPEVKRVEAKNAFDELDVLG